jgi:hypothetical protein
VNTAVLSRNGAYQHDDQVDERRDVEPPGRLAAQATHAHLCSSVRGDWVG